MDYTKLSSETLKTLETTGSAVSGYKTIWLAIDDKADSSLHIFRDEFGKYHFVIEDEKVNKNDIKDPGVNGLNIDVNQYRIAGNVVKQVIDLRCNMIGYLQEFTEVTKEIAKDILEENKRPHEVVNTVIRNWKTFWGNLNKQILSEEELIGLMCELKVLQQLFNINIVTALNSWTGPMGGKFDFNFSDWNFEVKGTRKSSLIHTINGIDQLKPANDKSLCFVSFLASLSNTTNSINLQNIIDEITTTTLLGRPDLIVRFNELLAGAGYSPIYSEEYRKFKIEIFESTLFIVDDSFPCLTSDQLNKPLSSRITSVRYDISLEGLTGKKFKEINWGEYFY